jgi:hypothetical protein
MHWTKLKHCWQPELLDHHSLKWRVLVPLDHVARLHRKRGLLHHALICRDRRMMLVLPCLLAPCHHSRNSTHRPRKSSFSTKTPASSTCLPLGIRVNLACQRAMHVLFCIAKGVAWKLMLSCDSGKCQYFRISSLPTNGASNGVSWYRASVEKS